MLRSYPAILLTPAHTRTPAFPGYPNERLPSSCVRRSEKVEDESTELGRQCKGALFSAIPNKKYYATQDGKIYAKHNGAVSTCTLYDYAQNGDWWMPIRSPTCRATLGLPLAAVVASAWCDDLFLDFLCDLQSVWLKPGCDTFTCVDDLFITFNPRTRHEDREWREIEATILEEIELEI